MKVFASLILALLLALPAVAQSAPTIEAYDSTNVYNVPSSLKALKEEQHKATLEIMMANDEKHLGAGCSATAIAPHVLLTAQHCNIEGGLLYLNQNERPFANGQTVTEKYFDDNDHMLLVVPSVEFKHYVTYDASKVRKIKQGEHLYFWGNPALMMNQYREVYATGVVPVKEATEVNAWGPFEMLSGPVVGGDSGSAIFSTEDGQLVGITTWGLQYGMFLGSYPLLFTQEQIDQATGNGMFVYIKDTNPKVTVNVQPSKSEPTDLTTVEELLAMLVFMFALPLAYNTTRKIAVFMWKPLKYIGRLLKKLWGTASKLKNV